MRERCHTRYNRREKRNTFNDIKIMFLFSVSSVWSMICSSQIMMSTSKCMYMYVHVQPV